MPDIPSKHKRTHDLVDGYVDALVSGDEDAGAKIVEEALDRGWTLGQVYADLFTPAHGRVTQLERRRAMTKAHLHLATQITLSHMERLRSRQPANRKGAGHRIMVAVAGGDEQLGASMIADVFRAQGWGVDLLSNSVPTRDLLELLKERKPEVAVMFSDAGTRSQKLGRLVKAVQRLPQPPALILAGTGVGQNGVGGPVMPGVQMAGTLEEALRIGEDVVASSAPDFALDSFLEGLGERIRAARRGLGLTQQALAEKAKLDRTYIVAVERGRQNVTVGAVMRIAEALGVPIDRLLVSGGGQEVDKRGSKKS